jgi:hypothetical protein
MGVEFPIGFRHRCSSALHSLPRGPVASLMMGRNSGLDLHTLPRPGVAPRYTCRRAVVGSSVRGSRCRAGASTVHPLFDAPGYRFRSTGKKERARLRRVRSRSAGQKSYDPMIRRCPNAHTCVRYPAIARGGPPPADVGPGTRGSTEVSSTSARRASARRHPAPARTADDQLRLQHHHHRRAVRILHPREE